MPGYEWFGSPGRLGVVCGVGGVCVDGTSFCNIVGTGTPPKVGVVMWLRETVIKKNDRR